MSATHFTASLMPHFDILHADVTPCWDPYTKKAITYKTRDCPKDHIHSRKHYTVSRMVRLNMGMEIGNFTDWV